MNMTTYNLTVKLEDELYHALRREAEALSMDVPSLLKMTAGAFLAQKHLDVTEGLTMPEIVVLIQSGKLQ